MPNLGTPEILILLLVIVLLFGATRLPKAAEGIGKAMKVFKKEIRSDDDSATEADAKPGSSAQALNHQAGGSNGTTPQSTSEPTSSTSKQDEGASVSQEKKS